MAFAGGPFNNFVFQATAALVGALRARGPATGAVTTVSGILTKPGLAVWSSDPDGQPPLRADLAGPAAAATDTLEVLVGYRGPATVATYTVTSTGPDPTRVLVLADTPGGARVMAASDDPALARLAVTEELIGTAVGVEGQGFTV
jgi:acetyl-CoA C-acetyltransferase